MKLPEDECYLTERYDAPWLVCGACGASTPAWGSMRDLWDMMEAHWEARHNRPPSPWPAPAGQPRWHSVLRTVPPASIILAPPEGQW